MIRALDRVIDRNQYPLEEAEASNVRHRPVGLGVQGLADVFALLRLPFDSEGARALNREIFETLYYGALEESVALAEELGAHPSHPGSPATTSASSRTRRTCTRGGRSPASSSC